MDCYVPVCLLALVLGHWTYDRRRERGIDLAPIVRDSTSDSAPDREHLRGSAPDPARGTRPSGLPFALGRNTSARTPHRVRPAARSTPLGPLGGTFGAPAEPNRRG